MLTKECRTSDWNRRIRTPHFWFVAAGVVFVTVAWIILRKMEHPWEGLTAKRLRQDRPWRPEDFGRVYGFWFGLGATILTGCTVIASRWWWKSAHPTSGPSRNAAEWSLRNLGRSGWMVLILIVAGAAWLRAPHLDRFILRDEQDTLRYQIHGYHEQDRETGKLEFEAMTWADAAFGNRYGNNPVLMTVISRAVLETWWRFADAPRDHYNAVLIRLPGFLAGLLSLVATVWCVMGFSPRRVALIAAVIAAIHPLHIDYSIQARGYAYVLLGVPLALGGAIRALQWGRWRDWIALVGGSAITLYAYLGGLFLIGPLVLTVFAILAWRWRTSRGDLATRPLVVRDTVRLLVTGLIGVPIYLTFAVPPLMSFMTTRETFPPMFAVNWTWWVALWTDYAGGRIFHVDTDPVTGNPAPIAEAFDTLVRPEPLVWIGMIIVVPIAVLGAFRLWKESSASTRALMAVGLISPFVQIFAHFFVTHMVLFAYYFIYWLTPLIGIAALGMDRLLDVVAGKQGLLGRAGVPHRTRWIAAGVVGLIGLYFSVGAGGNPYFSRSRPAPTEPTIYARGGFNWISYPEGRILKWESSKAVPAQFPSGDAASSEP